ncbi:B-box zinc finger protein 20 [Arachis duranensis]|uniref:B-box zinc finger protein 20 n=1 Tax=Arachis duranensis TaxID=130453 RepID=A0A6P4DNF6_ARADU|nr:B-box zinc finger protein 20 [Arachis duranensis]
MKIQCDVCSKDEASVFCTADEAALCNGCDHRVHHANKLASKHQRFSLLRLSTKQNFPLCDVCKERRAYVFCQQDRAILCKDCDIPIHSANEHTKKHTRFLVTGVKLSDSAKLYSAATTPPPPPLIGSNSSSDSNSKASQIPKSLVSEPTSSAASTGLPPIKGGSLVGVAEEDASTSTRSISEYLIETIPGWQVEDFLDSSTVPFGFSKGGDEMFSVFDGEIDGNMYAFSTMEKMGMWVPQAPPPPPPPLVYPSQFCEAKDVTNNNIKGSISRSRLGDDNFIVPQISLQSNNTKRPRYLW